MYQVTRQQIVDAAMKLHGVHFRHQGRLRDGIDGADGVDCVGMLVAIGREINFPKIFDVEGYRRTPSADTIRTTLRLNCDEIPIGEVRRGDIYLMRMGGRKPRHVGVRISDETDLARGLEPQLIHAFGMGGGGRVVIESVRSRSMDFAAGFRVRGLTDV